MRHFVPALVAVAVMTAAAAPPASAASSIGVSVGAGKLEPASPWSFDAYQQTSNVRFRFDAGSPYTELMLGLVNRTQTLAPTKQYVFETSGLSLAAGAHYGFVRAGLGLEAAWIRQIVMDSGTPGTLRFHSGGGFIVEPYAGVILPFMKTEVTEIELSFHYPVAVNTVDPAIGPRLLLTLWLGGEALDDDEEEEEEEEQEEEETSDEEQPEEPSVEPSPAPAPVLKPAPKPNKPAKPSKPATPKPRR